MSYVIYRKSDSYIITPNRRTNKDRFANASTATRALNKMLSDNSDRDIEDNNDYGIAEYSYYMDNIHQTKIVRNMMSGVDIEISVNTPSYCDPSCESYYTM